MALAGMTGLGYSVQVILAPFWAVAWCVGLVWEITGMTAMYQRGAATGAALTV